MESYGKILFKIKEAKYKIQKAREELCTCSSFVLQYEGGCQCRRGELIKEAYTELQKLIDKI